MRWSIATLIAVLTPIAAAEDLPLSVSEIDRAEPVDFATEIMPLFKRNCLACHHEKAAEGGLVLETVDQIRKGGDSGQGVVAKDVAASLVFVRATGSEEPLMPPEDNTVGAKPLSAEELGLLKLWIEQGAEGTAGSTAEPLQFQPIPDSIRTVYALDASPDGRFIAVSRGNRVVLYDTTNHTEAARLVDGSLGLGEVADVDLIQSLAFSPDSGRIATGGFRTVRLWSKQPAAFDSTSTPLSTAAGLVAVKSDATLAALVNAVGDIEIWNLTDRSRQHVLSGHADRITGLVLAETGDLLYSCDHSGQLIAWKLSSGQKVAEIETNAILSQLVSSADGSHVAAIDQERKVRLFQLTAETTLQPLAGWIESIVDATSIVLTDQPAAMLIVASESSGISMRLLADGQVVRSIDAGAVVDSLALSVDQTKLASGGRDGATRLWSVADGAALTTMQGDVETSLRLALASRDAARQKAAVDRMNQLTTSLQERLTKEEAALAKVNEEQTKALETLAAQEQARIDAAAGVSATEAMIAKAEADAQAAQAAIEAANQAMAAAVALKEQAIKEMEAKKKAVADAEAAKKGTETAIENRKQTIASATAAKQLAADAIPTHQLVVAREVRQLKHLELLVTSQQSRLSQPSAAVVGVTFSADGNQVATAHQDGDVRLYRTTDGLPLNRFVATPSLQRPAVAFAGDLVVGFSANQRASVWSQRLEWTLERTIGAVDDPSTLSDRVTALDFRRDGMSIAVGSGPPSRSGEVKIFAVDTGQLVRDFGQIHSDTVLGLQFSPFGRQLASSSADKTIRLLDIAGGTISKSMEGHTHHVLGIAWQDDGQTIASAGADQTVKLWDVNSGQQRRTIAGFGKEITAVTFVATSNQVVSACANGEVRINNAADGKQIKTFSTGGEFLYCVCVTPDGKQLLAGGHGGTIWIWDIAAGNLVAELK